MIDCPKWLGSDYGHQIRGQIWPSIKHSHNVVIYVINGWEADEMRNDFCWSQFFIVWPVCWADDVAIHHVMWIARSHTVVRLKITIAWEWLYSD
jgi:hypothetical protein